MTWWTLREFCDHYRISRPSALTLIRSGELRAFKMRGWKIRDTDRIEWERSREFQPKQANKRRPLVVEKTYKHL